MGGNGNQMPGKGTFGARVICEESRVGKFTEIGFTCTQPCGSECVCLESMLGGGRARGGGRGTRRRGPAALCASGRVGFGKVMSHTLHAPSLPLPPISPSPPLPQLTPSSAPQSPASAGSSDFAFEKASDTLDEHLADSWVA